MKRNIICLFLLISFHLCAQEQEQKYPYQAFFKEAYQLYPDVPLGVLEAVAYTNTHIRHINPNEEEASCNGLPGVYGVMGLILDGKGWFRENMKTVASLSGYSVNDIINSPHSTILAYAAAYHNQLDQQKNKNNLSQSICNVLISLSELNISNPSAVNDYTTNLYLYGIFYFLNDSDNQQKYGFANYSFDMEEIFGAENLKIFKSKQVNISGGNVINDSGQIYSPVYLSGPCPDYVQPNCTWVASPNHYTGWNGHTISAIAIHTVQGSYTSCINWFQNPDANAATHYVVASNSAYAGQVTQMVNEDNAGWHVTSENWYTLGYEHEGWVDDPSWYTTTMYQTSSALTRDICNRQNINPLRTFFRETLDNGTQLDNGLHSLGGETACIKIKGHQHFYNQSHTDPGPNWDWDYYYKLVNNTTPVITYNTVTGSFYDTGGSAGDYGNDERKFWLIQPAGAQSITLTFTQFAVEADYDFMYIYNGTSEFAPLIGRFNTSSPTTITSTGGALFVEFRSDCATTSAGWAATWTSTQTDSEDPSSIIATMPHWVNNDFTATFTDTDNIGGSGVDKKFYQVLDYDGINWYANTQNGFFNDNFVASLNTSWDLTDSLGLWNVSGGLLNQTYIGSNKTRLSAYVLQDSSHLWLYHWQMAFNAGSNRRSGIYIMCSDVTQSFMGNAYMIWFRADDDACQLYTVKGNSISTNLTNDPCIINDGVWYDYKVTYNPVTGVLKAYQNDVLVSTYTDPLPLKTGIGLSYRTGNASVMFDDLKIYKSRNATALVKVGPTATKDVRYQSINSVTESCRIKSMVIDANNNWSPSASGNIKVDWTNPATSIVALPAWQTGSFTATFNDTDALSGIETGYYQVLDNNNSAWGANASRGFFGDDFNVLDTTNTWKIPATSGSWSNNGSTIQQTDENVNNSNIYTALNQNLSDKYVYQFSAKVEGTGVNRRFGFHYFCDSASLSNRGNSYFVWFRVGYKTLEFFKVTNNNFSSAQKIIPNIITTAGQWYDFKIIFDKINGKTDVFRNDTLLGSWTDTSPLTNGKYISLRSGNSKLTFDEINVYRSRSNTANISVGDAFTNDIRYENSDPATSSAKIKTLAIDSASNLSSIYFYSLNTDFSPPLLVSVADGNAADIDTTTTPNTLKANWTNSFDVNSGITKYWYAIGTAPSDADIVSWTDNGLNLLFSRTDLTLTDGQIYYISVKAENGAGLQSQAAVSDGQLYLISTTINNNENEDYNLSVSPNPFKNETIISLNLISKKNINIKLFNNSGQVVSIIYNGMMNPGLHKIVLNKEKLLLSRGVYYLNFAGTKKEFVTKIIVL